MSKQSSLREFPVLGAAFDHAYPRIAVGEFPTPVQPMAALGAVWGHGNLWIKRDDVSSKVYGGNKVRKLEFLFADLRARGIGHFVVPGGYGSNQAMAAIIHGRRHGFVPRLVLFPQPETRHTRSNLRRVIASGVPVTWVPSPLRMVDGMLCEGIRAWQETGRWPSLLFPGATSPLTSLGYVLAMLELAEQIQAGECPEPHAVFVPLGSGGTAAGMLVGRKLAGLRTRIILVRVVEHLATTAGRLARLTNSTAMLLRTIGVSVPFPDFQARDLEIENAYFGKEYGFVTPQSVMAVNDLEEHENLPADTTYAGKTLAALKDYARKPEFKDEPLMFWNSYNSQALSPMLDRTLSEDEVPPPVRGKVNMRVGPWK